MQTKKETTVVVERKGEDAARLSTTCDLHGYLSSVHIRSSHISRTFTFCVVALAFVSRIVIFVIFVGWFLLVNQELADVIV